MDSRNTTVPTSFYEILMLIGVCLTGLLLFIVIDQLPQQQKVMAQTGMSPQISSTKNLSTYNNLTYGIKFQFPSNWNKIEVLSGRITNIEFISPRNNTTTLPSIIDTSIEKNLRNITSLDQYVTAANELLKRNFGNLNITTSQSTILSGIPAIERLFHVKQSRSGLDLMVGQIIAINNNKAYIITYTSEATKYSNYLPIFQKLVSSFRITK